MEEAPENGKESSHSAHANGMNELVSKALYTECLIQGILQQWPAYKDRNSIHDKFASVDNGERFLSLGLRAFIM
jgi:hypothetical protein